MTWDDIKTTNKYHFPIATECEHSDNNDDNKYIERNDTNIKVIECFCHSIFSYYILYAYMWDVFCINW